MQSTRGGQAPETALTRAQILQVVRETAAGVSGDGSVADDAPLMQAGIDSLGAVELRNRLVAQLGVKLPNTLTFDYPTIASVAGFIAEQVAPVEAPIAALRAEEFVNESVAILGMASRFGAGCNDSESFWDKLMARVDAMVEIPLSRWNVDAYYDVEPGQVGKMSTRKHAFVEGSELFDAALFGISPAE